VRGSTRQTARGENFFLPLGQWSDYSQNFNIALFFLKIMQRKLMSKFRLPSLANAQETPM
jgi:hypothetical protein